MSTKPQRYEHDKNIWDQCANTYERQIVRGHPDVTAYELFEHSVIEKLVLHLTRESGISVHCYDFGCGSGRIHNLLAPFFFATTAVQSDGTPSDGRLVHVGGIDFSKSMIELAKKNIDAAGFADLCPKFLSFDTGSAFDVPPYTGAQVPLAVSVCNSIGVMQGEEGAQALFRSMQQYVEAKNGIALISCYCREAVGGYALGNYESTMDVSGQPCWLTPDTYASDEFTLLPKYYKRAYDPDPTVVVDVFDQDNHCVERDLLLTRNDKAVQEVTRTGVISTFSDYQSRWYSQEQIQTWMKEIWGGSGGTLWHIPAVQLDRLRGEPAQLAILDYSGAFEPLGRHWNLSPLS